MTRASVGVISAAVHRGRRAFVPQRREQGKPHCLTCWKRHQALAGKRRTSRREIAALDERVSILVLASGCLRSAGELRMLGRIRSLPPWRNSACGNMPSAGSGLQLQEHAARKHGWPRQGCGWWDSSTVSNPASKDPCSLHDPVAQGRWWRKQRPCSRSAHRSFPYTVHGTRPCTHECQSKLPQQRGQGRAAGERTSSGSIKAWAEWGGYSRAMCPSVVAAKRSAVSADKVPIIGRRWKIKAPEEGNPADGPLWKTAEDKYRGFQRRCTMTSELCPPPFRWSLRFGRSPFAGGSSRWGLRGSFALLPLRIIHALRRQTLHPEQTFHAAR